MLRLDRPRRAAVVDACLDCSHVAAHVAAHTISKDYYSDCPAACMAAVILLLYLYYTQQPCLGIDIMQHSRFSFLCAQQYSRSERQVYPNKYSSH